MRVDPLPLEIVCGAASIPIQLALPPQNRIFIRENRLEKEGGI
jgi:hypothetical protein